MKVSIVIPVFNDPRIAIALDSIASQEFGGEIEVVVVDGGSTDGKTLDVVKGYGKLVTTLISERDKGIFDALNKGVERSSGDVIALIGADDRYADAHVVRDSAAALADDAIDATYGDLVYVDDDDNVARYWKSGPYRRIKLFLGWVPPHFTLFARRRVYDKVGLFDLSMRVGADYDWQVRMLYEHHSRVHYVPRVLLRMTLGGNSNRSLRNIAAGNIEAFRAWRKQSALLGLLVPVLKPASKLIQLVRRPPRTS